MALTKRRMHEQGITTLIRSVITGESYSLPAGFDLTGSLPFCTAHHITPLVYTGAKLCGMILSEITEEGFVSDTANIFRHSQIQQDNLDLIYSAYTDNGIDFLPLKGAYLKTLYPLPHHRPMGDADILIKESDYPAITRIMQDLGYTNTTKGDHDYGWTKPDALHIELHKRLFASSVKFYGHFDTGWEQAIPDLQVPHRFNFSPSDNLVYLFAHFTKHYTRAGVGIKHVTDLWVFLRTYEVLSNNLDIDYIHSRLSSIGLLDFYRHIRRLISVWFEDGTHDGITVSIADYIFSSHAFGSSEALAVSSIAGRTSDCKSIRNAKFRTLLAKTFPPLRSMRVRYNILTKAPFLLPVFWVVRFFDILFNRSYRFRQLASETKFATEKEVSARISHLKSIGIYKD